jgi:hypothetical protein
VQAAILAGDLDEARLRSYRRLSEELAGQASEAERREAKRQFFKSVQVAARARARLENRASRDR